jgi:hypothetical protein
MCTSIYSDFWQSWSEIDSTTVLHFSIRNYDSFDAFVCGINILGDWLQRGVAHSSLCPIATGFVASHEKSGLCLFLHMIMITIV